MSFFTLFFDGFVSSVPLYLRTLNPRKSKPSETWVITVFSSDSSSPLSWKNSTRIGFTSFSKISLDAPVMIKSSAYRIKLTLGLYATPLRVVCLNPERAFSIPFRAMLARVGDMIPPCGVPSSVGKTSPLKTNPHFNHLRSISLSIGTLFRSQSWLMWSKHPFISPSKTHSGE